MPSPIAHSATGYVIARILNLKQESNLRKITPLVSMALAVFIANMADIDFALEFLTGEDFHRGFTHSISFALGISILAVSVVYYLQSRVIYQVFSFVLIIYSSHLLLDFFTTGGSGMKLLWPFSNNYYSSDWSFFPPVHHSLGLFASAHIVFISFEITYSVIIYALFYLWKNLSTKRETKVE